MCVGYIWKIGPLREGTENNFSSEVRISCVSVAVMFPPPCPVCYLKGNSTDILHQSMFTSLGEYYCICIKVSFCGSRGAACLILKLPQVMSPESVSVALQDYKFDNIKYITKLAVWRQKFIYQTSVALSSFVLSCLRLKATLAATFIVQPNIWHLHYPQCKL